MTPGKIAAIVISSLVGAGVIGVLGTSVYNNCKYGSFTPYVSAKIKEKYNDISKREAVNVYTKYTKEKENNNVEAIKKSLREQYGKGKIKELDEEVHKRTLKVMKMLKIN